MDRQSRHYRKLTGMLWDNRREFILSLLCIGLVSGLLTLTPVWAKTLVHSVLPARDIGFLGRHLLLGISLVLAIQVFLVGHDFLRLRLSHRISANLRLQLFAKILAVPIQTGSGWRSGDLISRLSNDVTVFQNGLLRGLFKFVPNAIVLVCLVLMMFLNSVRLTMVTMFILVPMSFTVYYFIGRIRRRSKIAQEKIAVLNDLTGEAIRGIKEIKVFKQERRIGEEYDRHNRLALDAQVERDKMSALHPASVLLVTALACALLLFYCAWMVSKRNFPLENLTAFLTSLGLALSPIQEISRSIGFISKIYAVMDRFEEILAMDSEDKISAKLPPLPEVKGRIRFESINFSYGRDFALRDIHMDISAGETVAIVGPSGSGKTTLVSLIPRFLNPSSGTILIDNCNIQRFSLQSLREIIGYVPQEPILFFGTLRENLSFANPGFSDVEIFRAAEAAHVDEFVRELPEGYETHIGPHGSKLSVGQRQRIAIARAFLVNPQILILDEPTSALDPKSERLIRDSLQKLFLNRTTLIVAHRISTIRDVERIIVLDKGRIIERGTHDDLYRKEGLYHRMYNYQIDM